MKKTTLLLFFWATQIGLSQTIYFEDNFDDGDISDWTQLDEDGDGFTWFSYDLDDVAFFMASQSWDGDSGNALMPDNYSVSPAIDLSAASGTIYLNWLAGGQDPDFADENYSVYVATGNTVSDFMDSEAINFTENIGDDPQGVGGMAVRSLNISAFAGEPVVYIAFRHHDVSDEFILKIDDVAIATTTDTTSPELAESCESAQMVLEGETTVDAVDGYFDRAIDCTGDDASASSSVWYTFSTITAGEIIISTDLDQNAGGDTRMHVYSGTCESLVCVAGNDDVNFDESNYLSEVTFNAEASTTYYIAFDNFWNNNGFDFELSSTADLGTDDLFVAGFDHFYDRNEKVLNLSSTLNLEHVSIYSLEGRTIYNASLNEMNENINLAAISDGMYLAQVRTGGQIKTFNFLKN